MLFIWELQKEISQFTTVGFVSSNNVLLKK